MDFDSFRNDRKTIDAVIRNLEIIGEAARNIPEEIRSNYNEVDWRGMIGLRNRVIHEYFGVSIAIVWNIVAQELPLLEERIREILK